MEWIALFISILALMVGAIAYFRSAMERRASAGLAGRVKAGHKRSVRTITDLQSQVATHKENVSEELSEDIRALAHTLEGLAHRAIEQAKDLKDDVTIVAVEAESSLRMAVDEAKARLKVIEAKQELNYARAAILEDDLSSAEARVESALGFLKEARSLTADHINSVVSAQKQAQELLEAVRAKAGSIKGHLDALADKSEGLLREMTESAAEAPRKAA